MAHCYELNHFSGKQDPIKSKILRDIMAFKKAPHCQRAPSKLKRNKLDSKETKDIGIRFLPGDNLMSNS